MRAGLTLTVLGTATPFPRPDQACSGYLVTSPHATIWIDTGPGTFAEIQRHISLHQLDAVWISHMHPDHVGDLPAVANWLLNSPPPDKRLPIYGPPGWSARLDAFLPSDPALLADRVQVHELTDGAAAVIGDLHMISRAVHHGTPTFGLRITREQHVLAYSGDSGPCDALAELAQQADLFVCEAGDAEDRPSAGRGHCTPEDAAEVARRAGANRLLLTHLSPQLDPSTAQMRAQAIYRGVKVAEPGSTHRLDDLPAP